MDKPLITSLGQVSLMTLQKYERYLPTAFDESLTLLEKVNKIILYLNQIGEATNNIVEQWNTVMEWIVSNGLQEAVNLKIEELRTSGVLDQILLDGLTDLETQMTTLETRVTTFETTTNEKITSLETDLTTFETNTNSSIETINQNATSTNKKIDDRLLYVNEFGADPTGVSASDQAFIDAIQKASETKTKLIIDGHYTFTNAIKVLSGVHLVATKDTILDGVLLPPSYGYGNVRLFELSGQKGIARTLSQNVVKFADTISVPDGSFYKAGDLLLFESTDKYDSSAESNVTKTEMVKVKSVSGTTIALEDSLQYDYSTGMTSVYNVTPIKNVTLENISVKMVKGNAHNAIHVDIAENVNLIHSTIQNGEDAGMYLTRCYNAKVLYNEIFDCVNPSQFTAGYGVVVGAGSRHILIEGNTFRNNRHSVAGGSTAMFVDVLNNRSTGDSSHSLDCHEPCSHWNFRGNRVTGSFGGIVVRGNYCSIQDNEIIDVQEEAVIIKGFTYAVNEVKQFNITGNRIRKAKHGLFVDGLRGRIKGVVITGNSLEDCSGEAIFVAKVDEITITGNQIRNYGRGIRTQEAEMIVVNGNTLNHAKGPTINGTGDGLSVYNVGSVSIAGNSFKEGGIHCKLEFINKGGTVSGNTFENGGVYGVMCGDSKSVQILGNVFRGFVTNASKAIRTLISNVIIANNMCTGNTAGTDDCYCTDGAGLILIGNFWRGHSTTNTNVSLANNINAVIA